MKIDKKNITLKDVALRAGVSVATASRSLGNYGYVDKETKKKVLKAAKDLNYHFNSIAKGLRTKRTHTIGFLLPDITNPFYTRIAKGIQDYAYEKGYSVVIAYDDSMSNKTIKFFEMFFQDRMEGLIFSTPYNEVLEEMCRNTLKKGIPVVSCYGTKKVRFSDLIQSDAIGGCYKATKFLFDSGFPNFFVIKVKDSSISQRRFEGIEKFYEEIGKKLNKDFVLEVKDYSDRCGYEAAKEVFILGKKPTAIFCFGEQLAIGVMRAAKDCNISIPDELSLVSVDDVIASQLTPSITSVSLPVYHAGQVAANLIIERIEGKKRIKSREIYLEERFIIRESTSYNRLGN
ncbi:LacI family DNA-binding transcriptional regulator [Atribacter laminatus]|jgi:LacI family repressor for deo operon, udp, cdd, tsx, nupC, and nupG|uniref:Catabolite control protein A n=1 Tax=Atribacter laminatus TaxID=2847778 RepID=A0A7T1F395_ATRLM|nr:LacI family DNA-binding transcriptional regulator [Atribacter laminatus]QPM68146.1 Catabolite control protein A [Atribacter laminatus]